MEAIPPVCCFFGSGHSTVFWAALLELREWLRTLEGFILTIVYPPTRKPHTGLANAEMAYRPAGGISPFGANRTYQMLTDSLKGKIEAKNAK